MEAELSPLAFLSLHSTSEHRTSPAVVPSVSSPQVWGPREDVVVVGLHVVGEQDGAAWIGLPGGGAGGQVGGLRFG
ncbi:hypothetical protein [Streptomyces sp. MAA16]|uniref:hypothetical protein n=1 Tax=Streptomyces sp. MAA16 TaxID=3035116 RepID=UPI00247728BA|nr:hypothetical protein [Streptomyces sp. MAA16]MDH6697496.1 hypothetical protein [Streptomyces sp. MAA16]